MNSEETLKLTMVSPGLSCHWLMSPVKWAEFLTKVGVWPARGEMISATNLVRSKVGDPIVLTMGL